MGRLARPYREFMFDTAPPNLTKGLTMHPVPEGVYKIVSRVSHGKGKVADVHVGMGNTLYIHDSHGGENQKFLFFKADLDDYFIISRHNGGAVDHHPSGDVHIWPFHGDKYPANYIRH